ncbi:MAG: hypothetical protein ABEI76_07275 [Halobacteriales archaeon]
MKQFAVRQGFRLYGIALVIVAVWTGVWSTTGLEASIQALGSAWIGLGVLGIALLVGVLETRRQAFTIDEQRREQFTTNTLTGTPLHLYIGGLLAWSLVSMSWVALDTAALSATVIAGGWFVVAAFGGVLTLGLCVAHTDALLDSIPSSSVSGIE